MTTDYSNIYTQAGQQYGVDPFWAQAMATQESQEDPDAVSSKGASGIMQLMPKTAQSLGVKDVSDPEENIPAGVKYYAQNQEKYKDPTLALMAYNWGPGNVDKWIQNGQNQDDIPAETRQYVQRVNQNYRKFKASQPGSTVMQATPVAYQATEADNDPISAALSERAAQTVEKNLPDSVNDSTDPLSSALSERSGSADPAETEPEEGKTLKLTIHPHTAYPQTAATAESTNSSQPKIGAEEDVVRSLPTSITRGIGAAPQLPAYVGNALAQVGGWGYGKLHDVVSDTPYTSEQQNRLRNIEPFYTGNTIADQITKVGAGLTEGIGGSNLSPQQRQNLETLQKNGLTGDMPLLNYQPQTLPGKLTSAAIEAGLSGPAAGASDAVGALKAAKGAGVLPSAASGVAAQSAQETYPGNPLAPLVAGALPGVAGGIKSYVQGAPINPRVAELARNLDDDYGIKIPGYQLGNSPIVQRMGSTLERFGLTKSNNNLERFNSAIAESIGAPGENSLAPDVMKTARKNNSAGYDAVLNKIGTIDASGIDNELVNVLDNAKRTLTTNRDASVDNLKYAADEILDRVQPGDKISAKDYKSLTNIHSTLEDLTKNPDTAKHARMIEEVLHRALKNSAAPEDVNTLRDLDSKWKNMRTVQGLAAKSGASGEVSPAALLTPVAKSYKDLAYGGGGDLGTLATAGKTFKLTPSSGTFENSVMGRALSYLPEALAGGGALYHGANLLGAGGTALGTYGIGKAIGSALSSDWYRNHLIDKSLYQNSATPLNALVRYGLPQSSVVTGNQH